MTGRAEGSGLTFTRELAPDEMCELVLKIPFVSLESPAELDLLQGSELRRRAHATRGVLAAREASAGPGFIRPVPQLDALHRSHLTYVQISDPAMPGEPTLINTSVGTSTYSNCGNESCMINQELDQRGLADDARKRLEVWLRYQGTEPLLGRFSDQKGVLHSAGSFSFAASYNQNHGWILWRLAEHYPLHARPCLVRAREPGDARRLRVGLPPAPADPAGPAASRAAGSAGSCRPVHSRTCRSIATG